MAKLQMLDTKLRKQRNTTWLLQVRLRLVRRAAGYDPETSLAVGDVARAIRCVGTSIANAACVYGGSDCVAVVAGHGGASKIIAGTILSIVIGLTILRNNAAVVGHLEACAQESVEV